MIGLGFPLLILSLKSYGTFTARRRRFSQYACVLGLYKVFGFMVVIVNILFILALVFSIVGFRWLRLNREQAITWA